MNETRKRLFVTPRQASGFAMDAKEAVRGSQSIPALYAALNDMGIGGIDKIVSFGMDTALTPTVTTGSITTPIQFLQMWLPGFVQVQTAARKIDDFVGIMTAGAWEDEEIIQGIMEVTGGVAPYGDRNNTLNASWNVNYARRTIVRFESGMRVDSLEEARSAAIRANSAEGKREGASLALEIQRNKIGFLGYNNGANRTYGFLNDPSLGAYGSVPAGVSTFTTWNKKTFLEITADIRLAVATLRTQSNDLVDPRAIDLTLGLPTDKVDYLSVTSDFGVSVEDWIKKTYPKMRVVSAPQLNGANGGADVMYLYAESVEDNSTDGGKTFIQVVPAKFQVLGVQKLTKGYEEAYTNATAGVMCKRPWAVVRFTGI